MSPDPLALVAAMPLPKPNYGRSSAAMLPLDLYTVETLRSERLKAAQLVLAQGEPVASSWMPIATAPRDGTEVLLYAPGRLTYGAWVEPSPTPNIKYRDGFAPEPEWEEFEPYWASWDGGFTEADPPTHWMRPVQPDAAPAAPVNAGPLSPERIDDIWAACSDPDQPDMSIHLFAERIAAASNGSTVNAEMLAALKELAAEFRRVFPIYYYAEPWAHDKNAALKFADAVIASAEAAAKGAA